MSSRPAVAGQQPVAHGDRDWTSGTGWNRRLDGSEEGVDSPRFHSHSSEPACMRLGACWCPSSPGAAISGSVSLLPQRFGRGRTFGGGAVAGTGRWTRIIFGSLLLTARIVFLFRCGALAIVERVRQLFRHGWLSAFGRGARRLRRSARGDGEAQRAYVRLRRWLSSWRSCRRGRRS